MSQTNFGPNHPLAVKVWSKKLAVEARRRTYFSKFVGTKASSLIMEKTELKKSAGDQITCGLRVQMTGDGVVGDGTLEGNEEALQFYDDSIIIDQLRHAGRSKGKMSEQRIPYNIRQENMDGIADWWARRNDTALFNHLCGNTAETRAAYIGHNTVTAPTANRILRAGNQANDESLISTNTFKLQHIDVAKQKAITANTTDGTGPVIRPIRMNGLDWYVMFLHDYQVTDLRTDVNSNGLDWQDLQIAAMQGGDIKDNPIFTGALGAYNGVILHETPYVTNGVSSADGTAVANTKRAVLCGAQAAMCAYGGDSGPSSFSWKEELFDYQNQLGVSGGSIYGIKKCVYTPEDDSSTNAEDFGTVVTSTYAAPATPE